MSDDVHSFKIFGNRFVGKMESARRPLVKPALGEGLPVEMHEWLFINGPLHLKTKWAPSSSTGWVHDGVCYLPNAAAVKNWRGQIIAYYVLATPGGRPAMLVSADLIRLIAESNLSPITRV